jgi:hypothetical protein
MNARIAVLALIVAACGSPARGPRPLEAGDATDPIDRKVALIEEAAARACACADLVCAQQLDKEIAKALATAPAPRLFEDAEAVKRAEAGMQRAIRCMWAQGAVGFGFESAIVDAGQGFRAKSCACRDQACDIEVSLDELRRIYRLIAVPAREETQTAAVADLKEAADCRAHLHPAAPPSTEGASEGAEQAIDELRALRDRACACTVMACREEVQQDMLALAHRYESTGGSAEQFARMKVIGEELSACIQGDGKAKP